ncbi:SoxR reducing system RseC family protein [uncultured Sunxiuqinia sp.]|uniref:SoxR reducing system RseC family protein n=1 Tax=uncultured Sunxiuqinia sp. TaxID=1573825 RepID=UPI0030D78086|tara:strand:+ start:27616 stop:28032 length:417 start_codon:yes stop_codon:yes gene_type:complete
MSGEISHKGIIKSLTDQQIVVSIVNESACSSCHAKGACSAADMQDKEIEIRNFSGDYRVGQTVQVVGRTSQGFKALFYGYVFPFLIIMLVLITLTSLQFSEGISGLISLSVLLPYYLILYLTRNKIRKSFEFEIKPLL